MGTISRSFTRRNGPVHSFETFERIEGFDFREFRENFLNEFPLEVAFPQKLLETMRSIRDPGPRCSA
jgi:hypothetical protein